MAALIDEEDDSTELQHKGLKINTLNLKHTESYEDLHIDQDLKHNQRKELTSLLAEFADVSQMSWEESQRTFMISI